MSEALEKARREIEDLRRIINAQRSGLPSRLGVIVHSRDQRLIEAATSARLAPYGLSTVAEAEAAGCEVSVLCLPYCEGRTVEQTDPAAYEALLNTGKASKNGAQRIDNPQASNDQSALNKGFQTQAIDGGADQLPANFPQ